MIRFAARLALWILSAVIFVIRFLGGTQWLDRLACQMVQKGDELIGDDTGDLTVSPRQAELLGALSESVFTSDCENSAIHHGFARQFIRIKDAARQMQQKGESL